MFSRLIQFRAKQLVARLIQPLARVGITPNMLTLIGFLLSGITALVIAQGYIFAGGVLVLFASIFDMFDGAMARVQNSATDFGAFLDSTLDRYAESIILFGLLWYTLQHPGQQYQFWPLAAGQKWMIGFIFLAIVGSLMVSYTKARAEGLGIECKTGLLARPERVLLLAIGLLSNTGIWVLALLAIFTHFTALERIFAVWQASRTRPAIRTTAHNVYDLSADNHEALQAAEINKARETDVQPLHPGASPCTESMQQDV